jgi:DNA polymerase III subunit delta
MIFKSYLLENSLKDFLDMSAILFYGENTGLQFEFKNNIKKQFKEYDSLDLSQEEILKNNDLLYNEINNISLFGKKKIIFINSVNDKILDHFENIEPKIETDKICLFANLLDKKSKIRNYFEKKKKLGIVPCYVDNEITIKKIIHKHLKDFRGLTPNNINLIVESCNLDRNKLSNELIKIKTLFHDKKIVNEKLEKVLNTNVNTDFNILKDEALNGNKEKTNKLLSDTNLELDKNAFYLSMINQRLFKLHDILVKSNNKDIDNYVNNIKPPIFWKDKPKILNQLKIWNSKEKLDNIMGKSYKLELDIKSNSLINKNILLKQFIIEICNAANA